ncbi:protein transport protein S31 [Nowakowskiella sp. JEL0407]|nr:protein transport protein S31 [Nowakowskiella sp. JEL0407]
MRSGELGVWNLLAIIEGRKDDIVLILQAAHSRPVRRLEFNPSKSNLLESGRIDGEIFVWDLQNLFTLISPGSHSPKLEDVTVLSWNPHHEHILATASNNGYTVVKPITSLAWHPNEPLKLVTTADDDGNPQILVWDLKNAYAPERTIDGHQRGILSVSWNPKDADLLLSCSKDNKVLLTNPNTGEFIGEVDTTRNWAFGVQWCPRNPDLFAVSSFDGRLVVHSLQGKAESKTTSKAVVADSSDPFAQVAQNYQAQQHDTSGFKLTRPPKWFYCLCSATFGFGGKLVTLSNKSTGAIAQQQYQPRIVSVRVVPAEPELVA